MTASTNAVKHLAEERVRRQARPRTVCRARGDRWLRSLSPDSQAPRRYWFHQAASGWGGSAMDWKRSSFAVPASR